MPYKLRRHLRRRPRMQLPELIHIRLERRLLQAVAFTDPIGKKLDGEAAHVVADPCAGGGHHKWDFGPEELHHQFAGPVGDLRCVSVIQHGRETLKRDHLRRLMTYLQCRDVVVPVRPEVLKLSEPHLRRHTQRCRKNGAFLHESLMPLFWHRLENHFVYSTKCNEECSRSPPMQRPVSNCASNAGHQETTAI
jgi:hypothetical protein